MGTESSTKQILLGTDRGKVYEHGLLEKVKETTSSTSSTSQSTQGEEDAPVLVYKAKEDAVISGLHFWRGGGGERARTTSVVMITCGAGDRDEIIKVLFLRA